MFRHRGPALPPEGRVVEVADVGVEAGIGLADERHEAQALAVAARFDTPAISMLVAWDDLLSERSFLDPLSGPEATAFEAAESAIFDVALELAERL